MRVLTIGHSSRNIDDVLGALAAFGAEELCDVRAYPGSTRHPQFARANLREVLGARYVWLGRTLGGFRENVRSNSPHTGLRNEGFRNYADYMESDGFASAIDDLLERAARAPVAIMCAERHWSQCHRSLICDYLVGVRGVEVVHILDENESEPHKQHKFARVSGDKLIYDIDRGQATLF